jgi:hypothetical protein
MPQEQLVRYQ